MTTESSSICKRTTAGAVDCDVHPSPTEGLRTLAGYMEREWAERLGLNRRSSWGAGLPAMEVSIPIPPWVNVGGSFRADAVPPGGGIPASDPAFVVEDLLDRYDFAAAVLTGQPSLQIGAIPDPDSAAAIAAAHNDWIAAEWLTADPRFKSSIVIGPRTPGEAPEEIRRWADHPGMVQVYVPTIDIALGDRHFWPVLEAADHYGLPICLHPGGEGAGVNEGLFPMRPPTYYFEYHAAFSLPYQAQLISLIGSGAFERFPRLKVIFAEAGFAWLVETLWRLDQNWHAVRNEVPWIKRPPSEYVREHVRFTTQPMYEPGSNEHLRQLIEMIDGEEILCYSSDYPHWDNDSPDKALNAIPPAVQAKIMRDNPRALYGGEDW
jgi:uncharacterized protein